MHLGTRLTAAAIELAVLSTALTAQTTAQPASETPVRTQHAMVVSIQHNATDAGVEILKQGGNAVDAAVAVGFALAVVYPFAGNIGGGGFMVIRHKHSKTHLLHYREKTPPPTAPHMALRSQSKVVPATFFLWSQT